MKACLAWLIPLGLLLVLSGCDSDAVPDEMKTLLSAQNITGGVAADGLGLAQQIRQQLRDGSCGDGGAPYRGQGEAGPGGNGTGEQLRLRDGSCGD